MAIQLKDHLYARHRAGDVDVFYELSDVDEVVATETYAGYLNPLGGWIIIRYVVGAGITTIRYKSGKDNYSDNWNNRAALVYKLYNEMLEEI